MMPKERTRKGISKWRPKGIHTLKVKKNRKLIVMVFDDRVIYSYAKTVPQYREADGVYRLRDEPVMICDNRTGRDHD